MFTATETQAQMTSRTDPRQRPTSVDLPADASAVTCITRADIPVVAAAAARLAQDDLVAGWLLPDPRHRLTALRGCFALLLEHALQHGFVDRLAGERAVAIWLDRTRSLPTRPDLLRRLQQMCGHDTDAALLLADVTAHHAPPSPHLHLALLAADTPADAAVLLAHRQQRLDRVGVAAFAYASTQAQLEALMDAGFQPSDAVRLPAGPPLWLTLRPVTRDP